MPHFVFFSPLPWLYNWWKSLQVLALYKIIVNVVTFEFFLFSFDWSFSGYLGETVSGSAGRPLFYTILLCCECSHCAFLYSDSLKNNSCFLGELFLISVLVFQVNISLILQFGMPNEVVYSGRCRKMAPLQP